MPQAENAKFTAWLNQRFFLPRPALVAWLECPKSAQEAEYEPGTESSTRFGAS